MYQKTQRRSDLNIKQDNSLASKRFVLERKPDTIYFYELEEAVVVDIILDESHPEFKRRELDKSDWPANIDGSEPVVGDKDYGVIGQIKFRFLNSQQGVDKTILNWAFPMENTGVVEYPLMNEVVVVAKYSDKYYYSRKLNIKQTLNSNADFSVERVTGYVDQNLNVEVTPPVPYTGPVSKMNFEGGTKNYEGVLGNDFKFNPNIRALRRYEGDTIVESRFGSTIRFGAYNDDKSANQTGAGGDYGENHGNPMILIRNRQAPITQVSPEAGFTAKGYTVEDINLDGSSIHITSGKTVSRFLPTTKKIMFGVGKEEQENFSPEGSSQFKFPLLDGDQLIINSDRLIFSSKANETFHYSKKRLAMVTDDEFTVDSHKQVVVTTNDKTVINSPQIFLGAYGDTDEPVLLGRTSAFWLYQMCELMINNIDIQISQAEAWHAKHVHGRDSRKDTQFSPETEWVEKMTEYANNLRAQRAQLTALRDKLPSLMSTRVFTVGGGGSPGYDGGALM